MLQIVTKVSDKKVQISSWPVQAFVQRQMKGRSCMCMALSCKKTMADPHDSNRERMGQEGSSKGILMHHAKEWWQAHMTGNSLFVSLNDQASERSNANGQQSTKKSKRQNNRKRQSMFA